MAGLICFDMDGTIADLYSVPDWLKKLEAEDPSPYFEAEPLCDMERLRDILIALNNKGYQIRVISWFSKKASPEYKKKIREAKLNWLKRYDFPMEKAHFVAYGTTKANCVRSVGLPAILIDDNERVRDGWHLGTTIDPVSEDLLEALETLL